MQHHHFLLYTCFTLLQETVLHYLTVILHCVNTTLYLIINNNIIDSVKNFTHTSYKKIDYRHNICDNRQHNFTFDFTLSQLLACFSEKTAENKRKMTVKSVKCLSVGGVR